MATAVPTNRDKFLADFTILHQAGVGVTAIRTKEGFRALETIQAWAQAHMAKCPFKFFSQLQGWVTVDASRPNAEPTADGVKDIMSAIAMIDGATGGQSAAKFPDGVYAVFWPHFALPKIPPLIQMLAELARSCAENVKRVVLIVPPSFVLPQELQESVVLMDFDVPNRQELRQSYDRICESVKDKKKPMNYGAADVDRILNAVVGMTEYEAESAIARAQTKYKDQFPNVPVDKFVATLMEIKVEVIRRSECLEIMPVVPMADVGGLAALKSWVTNRKSAFTPGARDAGVDRPRGYLLVGPPGTAKSLAVKATAHELGLPLIRFDLSRVYGGHVGDSEANVRAAIKTIKAMAPCIVLIDEVDKAVSKGRDENGGVAQRVLGTILTEMQEGDDEIFWALTANRTASLPSELVRKGRLDEIFSVTLPNEEERKEIFRIHLRKRKEDINAMGDVEPMILKSTGHVGAEIEAAVKEAKLAAFNAKTAVTVAMIVAEFGQSKPLSEAFKEDFDTMKLWAENNARPASGATPTAASVAGLGTPRARTRTMPVGLES